MQAAANSPGAFLCSSQSCEIATAPAEPRNDKSGSLPHPEGRNDKAGSAPLPCHCEEGVSPTWQSQAGTYESAGAFLCSSQACEIATAPAEPRNDKSGSPPHLRPRAAERTKSAAGAALGLSEKPRRVCARRRKENGNHFLRRRVRRRKYRSARKRAKGVPFVRCSEPQPLSNESPVKRVSFESLPKPRFGQAHPAGGNRRDRYQGSCVGSAASAGSVGSAGSADTSVGVDGSAAPS